MPNLEPKLGANVKTRLETLYYFIYEMAESFGVDDDGLDSITKGILKRKIIREITINYKNEKDVVLGRVIIKIDWEKHTLLASTDYGASFTLDSTKSVRSQVSEISDIILEHVQNMKKALNIKKISTTYRYISEITSDTTKHEEARQYMGHSPSKGDEVSIQKEFTSSIEWLCDKLKEVKIIVQSS